MLAYGGFDSVEILTYKNIAQRWLKCSCPKIMVPDCKTMGSANKIMLGQPEQPTLSQVYIAQYMFSICEQSVN